MISSGVNSCLTAVLSFSALSLPQVSAQERVEVFAKSSHINARDELIFTTGLSEYFGALQNFREQLLIAMDTQANAGAFKHFDLFKPLPTLKMPREQKPYFDVIVPNNAVYRDKGDEQVELSPALRSSLIDLINKRTDEYLSAAISACGATVRLSDVVLSPSWPSPRLKGLVTVGWPNGTTLTTVVGAQLKPIPSHFESTINDRIALSPGVFSPVFGPSGEQRSYDSQIVVTALREQLAKGFAQIQLAAQKLSTDESHPLGKANILLEEKAQFFTATVLQDSLRLKPAECFSIVGSELPWTAKEVIRRYCSASKESLKVSLPVKPPLVEAYDLYLSPDLPFAYIHQLLILERSCKEIRAKISGETTLNLSSVVALKYELFQCIHSFTCNQLMEWRYPNGASNDPFAEPPTLLLTIERSFEFERQRMLANFYDLYGGAGFKR